MGEIWRWILRFAERRLMAQPGVNLLCRNCRTWSKIVPVKSIVDTNIGYISTCGRCGWETSWDTGYPVPVFVKIVPLEAELNYYTHDEMLASLQRTMGIR